MMVDFTDAGRDGRQGLVVAGIAKSYATPTGRLDVLRELSFQALPGEIVCIVGPSGVGKTTLLRCMSGLLPPSSGTVSLDGEQILAPHPGVALVFQDYGRSLFPWMTARGNVEFPLFGKRVPRPERSRRAQESLEIVGLGNVGDRYPWQMSGGMQQRVAIARALAYDARILLADEPFASVDAQTKLDLEDLVVSLRNRLGLSIVIVTHDIDEAVYLSDRIVVLSGKPASVLETVNIDFGKKRSQSTTRLDPRFAEWRARILDGVRGR